MTTGGGRWAGLRYAAVCVLAVGAAAMLGRRALPDLGVGDVDPIGAAIAFVSMAAGTWSAWLAVRSLRWQHRDVPDAAAKLAQAVLSTERSARRQLLGDHDRTIDVGFVFRPAPAHGAAGAQPYGSFRQVVGYYRRLRPGRMVISGAGGAGKTVLAVELILGLLEERKEEDPVPVRLSAASWNPDDPVENWLTRHLVGAYRMPETSAWALVDARLVLPVVDGLDEMDANLPGYASRAGKALRALNAYQHGRAKAEVVLTCRSEQYEALEDARTWAHDAARVEIQPVGPAMAREFLSDRVDDLDRWRPVFQALDRDPSGPLARGLSTPWRLTLAATGYEQRDSVDGAYLRDPRELTTLDDPQAIRDHLLGLFIPAATAVHPPPAGVSAELAHTWLATLADYLSQNAATARTLGGRPMSGTDIVLHELWPLAGTRLPRAVHAAIIATIWLVTGTAVLAYTLAGGARTSQTAIGAGMLLLPAITLIAIGAWQDIWPEPTRADPRQLRTEPGRRRLAGGLAIGLACGLAIVLTFAFAVLVQPLATEDAFDQETLGMAFGVVLSVGRAGLASGLTVTLVFGLAVGIMAPATTGMRDPRDPVRADLVAGLAGRLAFGLGTGFILGFVLWLTSGLMFLNGEGIGLGLEDDFASVLRGALVIGSAFGLVFGSGGGHRGALAFGVSFGPTVVLAELIRSDDFHVDPDVLLHLLVLWLAIGVPLGLTLALTGVLPLGVAGVRYFVLLLCTRRWADIWLPWRLGRFLHWCYGAGLVRVAGIAYQFRHRELQDYLTRNATP
ncbi:NACHT domain-containing protein [Spirillospora sp. NPDC048819]|uniref:NACHT domain-containing protein n=1 Tax=Spirillospora sp. NPDC048819 TaxID=3155268 RepID=UPI0033EE9B61